jgi:hypothetical protein
MESLRISAKNLGDLALANGFVMGFASHLEIVECQPSMIPPMLAKFRRIYELPQPPAGRSACEIVRPSMPWRG